MKLPNPNGQKAAVGYLGVVKLATSHERRLQKRLSEVLYKIGVFKNFAKFAGKHLCWSFFSM